MNNDLCLPKLLSAYSIGCRIKLLESLKSIISILNDHIYKHENNGSIHLIKYIFNPNRISPSEFQIHLQKLNSTLINPQLIKSIYSLKNNWYNDLLDTSDLIYIQKINYLIQKINL